MLGIQVTAKWLHGKFLKAISLHRPENFTLYVTGQILLVLGMAHSTFFLGSLPTQPLLLIALLLFHVFYWLTPAGVFRSAHTYFVIQSLLATLAFTQGFLGGYLFLILVGQSVVRLRGRSILIWIGAFSAITLSGTLYLYGGLSNLDGASAAIPTLFGFVLIGGLSFKIVQERQAREKVRQLMTELSDTYAQLQKNQEQSKELAVAEERNRLGAELRHVIGHRLTASIVQLEGASRLMEDEPQRATGMIEAARAQLDSGLHELRYTFKELRDPDFVNGFKELEPAKERSDVVSPPEGARAPLPPEYTI